MLHLAGWNKTTQSEGFTGLHWGLQSLLLGSGKEQYSGPHPINSVRDYFSGR